MRKLSLWAKHHPIYARVLIIISRCLLFGIACFLGKQFTGFGWEVSPLWTYLLIAVFFITGATYPSKRSKENYWLRKGYDLAVICIGFFMTLFLFMQLSAPSDFYGSSQAALRDPSPYRSMAAKKLLDQFQAGEKTSFTRKEKRLIKKEFQYQLVRYAKAKLTGRKADAEAAVLIFLSCIAAVGLFYLVLALSCALACNGSDVFAMVVLIIGTAAVVWGLIAVIRNISHKPRKVKAT